MQTVVEDRESSQTVAAVNCYFMCQDGSMFKAQVAFAPYFYLHVQVRAFGDRCRGQSMLKRLAFRASPWLKREKCMQAGLKRDDFISCAPGITISFV